LRRERKGKRWLEAPALAASDSTGRRRRVDRCLPTRTLTLQGQCQPANLKQTLAVTHTQRENKCGFFG